MIHVSRSGATLGIFEEEKVREGLRTGQFIGTDLGWMEGMPTWRPLSELESFHCANAARRLRRKSRRHFRRPQSQPVVPGSRCPGIARAWIAVENRTSDNFFNALDRDGRDGVEQTRAGLRHHETRRRSGRSVALRGHLRLGRCLISLLYQFFMKSLGMGLGRNGLGQIFGFGIRFHSSSSFLFRFLC